MLLAGPCHCPVTVDLMGSRRPPPGTWPPRRCLTSRSSSWSSTPIRTEFWLSHKSKMPSGFLENLSEVSTISVWSFDWKLTPLGILFRWRTVVYCEKVLCGYKELVSGVQRVSKNAGLSQKRQVCQKLRGTSCSLRVCTFVLHNNKQCIRTWTMNKALKCLHRHWYSQYSEKTPS